MHKPKMFIASSSESKHIAEKLHMNLVNDVEVTLWRRWEFNLTQS